MLPTVLTIAIIFMILSTFIQLIKSKIEFDATTHVDKISSWNNAYVSS